MARPYRLLLTFAVLLAAMGVAHAEQPPQELHLEGDHWTAWDPPETVPEGAEVHSIAPGDTLWDLSERFLGDPYLWPQLWERNRYILDAHWIYPGDPLVINVSVTPIDTLAAQPTEPEAAAEDEAGFRLRTRGGPPEPLGTESDIYCSGYIGEQDEPFDHAIIGSEHQVLMPVLWGRRSNRRQEGTMGQFDTSRYTLSVGDIVYVDGGRQAGLVPGTEFMIVQPENNVRHPVRGQVVGRHYRYMGRLRVLSVQPETAIAEINWACHPIVVGAMLQPFEPEPVPLARRTAMRPVNQPASEQSLVDAPVVLHPAEVGMISMGQGNVLFIDRGALDSVTPGDMYTVYRMNVNGMPPVVLGELAVLSVQPRSATARILESRYPILVGDRLGLK